MPQTEKKSTAWLSFILLQNILRKIQLRFLRAPESYSYCYGFFLFMQLHKDINLEFLMLSGNIFSFFFSNILVVYMRLLNYIFF